MLILLLFFISASRTLFLRLLLLVLQMDRDQVLDRGKQFIKTTYVERLLLLLSSDFVGSSLVDIWLEGSGLASRCRRLVTAPSSLHRPSPSTWLPTTFQFHLHTCTSFFFCDQRKEVKAGFQKMTRIPKPASGFSALILSLQS